MLQPVRQYAARNWLITPAARAVNTPPAAPGATHGPLGDLPVSANPDAPSGPTAADQRWLLVLTGVAMVDFKGNSEDHWRRDTLPVLPDFSAALDYATTRHHMPTPPGVHGKDFFRTFQAEQWAPYAGLAAIYDKNHSIDAGFAVESWRPSVFGERKELGSPAILKNLWRGIDVDIAVRDTDAVLQRINYSISLIGRIVFVEPF